MPEGDTVHRTARRLHRALSGQQLTATDFRVPQHATSDLAGETVVETVARGKHLLTRFSGGLTLHTHLKMEGAWRTYRGGERWRRPAHQARVVLTTATTQAVGFSLGVVELLPTAEEHTVVGHLGPDVLGPDWDEDEALRRLREDPGRTIGEALLDQRCLAGLGTVYMSETLYLAGVGPLTPVGQVPDLAKVVRLGHRLLNFNNDRTGPRAMVQVTTGDTRTGQEHYVYLRTDKPCRRCGTTIETGLVGSPPRERRTYWCPHCQP